MDAEKSPNPTIPPLPPDVLCHHILNRLPVKILVRFSCVCKQWRRFITSDQAFVKSHLQNQAPRNILLYSSNAYCSNSDSRGDWTHEEAVLALGSANIGSQTRLAACCDGVFCLDKRWGYDSVIFLWNPALHQRTALPTIERSHNTIGLGFGFDDTSGDYKVIKVHIGIAIVESKKRLYSNVDVYSLSSHSWKTIDSEATPIRWSERYNEFNKFRPACAIGIIHGGYFYWTNGRGENKNAKGRSKFPLFLNKVRLTQAQPNGRDRIVLPDHVSIYRGYQLTIFKGCISLCGYGIAVNDFQVWSMMDSGATWLKQLLVMPSNLQFFCRTPYGSRILFYRKSNGCARAPMVLYDLENETIDENVPGGVTAGIPGSHTLDAAYYVADNYAESLVSIVPPSTTKLGQRRNKSFSQKLFGCFSFRN